VRNNPQLTRLVVDFTYPGIARVATRTLALSPAARAHTCTPALGSLAAPLLLSSRSGLIPEV